MLNEKASIVLALILMILCFLSAGVADGVVNDDWNRLNSVPVTIETHYIINGNDYVVSVEDVMTTIHWDGDKPVLNSK